MKKTIISKTGNKVIAAVVSMALLVGALLSAPVTAYAANSDTKQVNDTTSYGNLCNAEINIEQELWENHAVSYTLMTSAIIGQERTLIPFRDAVRIVGGRVHYVYNGDWSVEYGFGYFPIGEEEGLILGHNGNSFSFSVQPSTHLMETDVFKHIYFVPELQYNFVDLNDVIEELSKEQYISANIEFQTLDGTFNIYDKQ